jgi:hypothetical protein
MSSVAGFGYGWAERSAVSVRASRKGMHCRTKQKPRQSSKNLGGSLERKVVQRRTVSV